MYSPKRGRWRGTALAACIAGLALIAPSVAQAELSPIVFSIEATSSAGTGSWKLTLGEGGTSTSKGYSWTRNQPIEIRDTVTDAVIATLNWADVVYIFDPQAIVQFQVTAGNADTDITITSALNAFPGITNAIGRASAGVTVTDLNGDGASLTGLGVGGAAYEAHYNGMVPAGTPFAELLTAPVFAGIADTGSANDASPGGGAYTAIAGTVTDMSARFHFRLSAFDSASGTSNFEIVPEPGAVVLLSIGIGLVARRRRRR